MEHFNDGEACFMFFRRSPSETVLVRFVSDHANVRTKMLYASATAEVRRELGATTEFWGVSKVSHIVTIAH